MGSARYRSGAVVTAVALTLSACLAVGCSKKLPTSPTPTASTPTTTTTTPPTSSSLLTLSPSSLTLAVNSTAPVVATFLVNAFASLTWTTDDSSIASVAAETSGVANGNQRATLTCKANGTTNWNVTWVDNSTPPRNQKVSATVVCGTGVKDPPPPSQGSPKTLVGSWVKRGTRTSGSNCSPPAMGSSFEAGLVIELSSQGNSGVRFAEAHTGLNSAGPYLVTLFYSQFESEQKSNGLQVDSGFPEQNILGKTFTTHLSLFFADDGTILGTETFESAGPPPCKDTYIITGERAK